MPMMKTIRVRLREEDIEVLRTLADREDREIRKQAAWLIREQLMARGFLGKEPVVEEVT